MDFIELDITNIEDAMQLEDPLVEKDSYDIVIDKACLDCIACHEDDEQMVRAVNNIHSIIMPGGYYFLISRGPPDIRMHLFESQDHEPEASEVNDDSDNDSDGFKSLPNVDPEKWA
jgi:hypothetical protein